MRAQDGHQAGEASSGTEHPRGTSCSQDKSSADVIDFRVTLTYDVRARNSYQGDLEHAVTSYIQDSTDSLFNDVFYGATCTNAIVVPLLQYKAITKPPTRNQQATGAALPSAISMSPSSPRRKKRKKHHDADATVDLHVGNSYDGATRDDDAALGTATDINASLVGTEDPRQDSVSITEEAPTSVEQRDTARVRESGGPPEASNSAVAGAGSAKEATASGSKPKPVVPPEGRRKLFENKVVRLVHTGLQTALSDSTTWRLWEDDLEKLKPGSSTGFSQDSDAFEDYSNALHHRVWLSEFLGLCATELGDGQKRPRSAGSRQQRYEDRKLLIFVIEVINRLSRRVGTRAFHMITALAVLEKSLTRSMLHHLTKKDMSLATENIAERLSCIPEWDKLSAESALNPVSVLINDGRTKEWVREKLNIWTSVRTLQEQSTLWPATEQTGSSVAVAQQYVQPQPCPPTSQTSVTAGFYGTQFVVDVSSGWRPQRSGERAAEEGLENREAWNIFNPVPVLPEYGIDFGPLDMGVVEYTVDSVPGLPDYSLDYGPLSMGGVQYATGIQQ